MATVLKSGVKHAKPILSLTHGDARRRTLNLYKAWYRQIPYIVNNYLLPKTEAECKQKLREEFKRYAHIRDIRAIDLLLIKGQMELQEICSIWKPTGNLLNYWKDTEEPKPTDFMSKFIAGQD
ncbi:NADH dehydrogenase [ubiquinone] 1 alpha subcomplex subunit 6 [Eufriesea mexicana]|uniref:NADH dehydrogenase [ubiquinone] 1 alpha subcomplex subunit 6 n=1 Tax=Eufriesea mexicana TaxID=516756 RepID=UPI00083C8F7D|nr:PREDICTED: NADH dehydrogenase [ubiquinone] 1 alpha subcomplex subunit 6 [Eufriesea mexicana]OAD60807.1 NADH dehydrogenase [ubiquinone] 1 alpha subcomplex subunit 6 [Eufriesea mexicana]